jgi:hypothetical protein
MKLAIPYLESLDYIERYNWYQPNSGTANFYITGSTSILSDVGITYRDQVSTPSIPETTVDANNNLSLVEYPNVVLNKMATVNSSYSPAYDASKAVDGDITSSSSQWILNFGNTSDANYAPLPAWLEVDLKGSFNIDSFRIIEFDKASKNFSFDVWDSSLNSGAGGWTSVVTVANNPATPLTYYKTFTPVTTTKVRLSISAHNSVNYLRLFELEVFGVVSENLSIKQYEKQQFSIYPNPVTKGEINIVGDQEVENVEVYNLSGAKINVLFENDKLRVTNLSPGVYFLRVNKKYNFKFIKK